MKKVFTILFAALIASNAFSQVVGEKAGKVYTVRFYKAYADTITIEQAENDFRTAIGDAVAKKCTTLSISDNEGLPWMFVIGKENLEDADTQVAKFKSKIEEMKSFDFVEGKEKRIERVNIPSKYRSETYLNGELIDTYESDWDSGYFKTTTSTYKSGKDTYLTKTFYVPPKTIEKEYATGESVEVAGIVNFVNKVYFIK